MGDKKANRLGGVDRATSSQSDQTVATMGVVLLEAGQDIRLRRVGLNALENDQRRDRGRDLGNNARGHQSAVGYQQRPRDAQPVQLGRQRCPRPDTEDDAIGKSKQPASAGNQTVGGQAYLRRRPRQPGRSPDATV